MAEIGGILGGRYRLVELLGQGGMATIYRARDNQLERDVAAKVLRPEYGRDPDFGSRFRQEAQAAASLNHPNVVSVYDYGQDEAGPYIVMELVDGEDLASVIRRTGALPPRQAARLTAEIARALSAAHGRGFVHRDVKPGNVLLSRDGRVKVTDFGIARAVAEAQMTLPGTTLGSVHYFSPEQARGEPATPSSDVYSLGIVLYELLTGRRPWEGDSAASIAMARLSGAVPSPSTVRAGIPPTLEVVARRAMALDPAARFPSASAMAEALDAFLGDRAAAQAAGAAAVAAGARASSGVEGRAAAAAGGAAVGAAVTPRVAAATGPATVASGVARPNPNRVPYAADSYAGTGSYTGTPAAGRSPGRRSPDEAFDDESSGGTSPWVWISALLALAILAVVGFLVVRLLAGPGEGPVRQVTVPDFVGKQYEVARDEADRLGIKVEISSSEISDRPANEILRQDRPPDSKIDEGGTVSVVVARGQDQVPVPDLRGKTENEALQLITDAGLRLGVRTQEFDAIVPEGSVVSQSPAPGVVVAVRTPIDYIVSRGPEPTPTPEPTPSPTPEPTPTPAPTPSPTPELLTVQDYRCMTVADAKDAIVGDGFRVGQVDPDNNDWYVATQDPPPDSSRPRDTRINLTASEAPPFDPCGLP